MNRFDVSALIVLAGLAWIHCTPVEGDSPDGGGGATSGGASASGGTQPTGTGGSGGDTAGTFACGGTTMCTTGEQACRGVIPGVCCDYPTVYTCVPFPDGCTARDCSCFCTDAGGDYPTLFPCAMLEGCTCSGRSGHIQVGCLQD